MKTKLTILLPLLLVQVCWGQETRYFDLNFDKDTILVYDLKPNQTQIVEIGITGKFLNGKVKAIKVEQIYTDLSERSHLNLNFSQKDLSKFETDSTSKFKEKLYLSIAIDSLLKEDKVIVFGLRALDSSDKYLKTNIGERQQITVRIKRGSKDIKPLKNYKYLSYIGTNFDLVEGIKADKLFFATNVFVEPTKTRKDFGVYLSLYGERTTSLREEFDQEILTEIVPVTADSSYRLSKRVTTIQTTTSDNLGAHFSTLHPIFGTRDKEAGELKMYFTASTDFIWQRTHILTEYGDVISVDTMETVSTGHHIILNPLESKKTSYNQFNFNIGPGLFFVFENESISVRVHASAGYTGIFSLDSKKEGKKYTDVKRDCYFAGRAWITEPKTGITLQAEIMNRFIHPKPSYVVSLSKAFNLSDLAGIFSPITNR